eukprot:COSAG06_NODE_3974_length_4699_cov_37.100435_3_plen_233_part_00
MAASHGQVGHHPAPHAAGSPTILARPVRGSSDALQVPRTRQPGHYEVEHGHARGAGALGAARQRKAASQKLATRSRLSAREDFRIFTCRSLRSTTAVPLALLRSDLMSRRVQLLRRDAESGRRQSEVAAGGAGGRWGRAWRGRCCGSRRRQRRTRCGGKTRSSTSLPCASRWPSSAFAIGILMPIMMVSMHSGFVVTPSATRHDGRLESECWVHSWQFLVSIQIPARPPLQL